METLVKIRDLHKVYYRGSERIDVLQGVTLDIPQGDFLALMGPSGSGKTTLLNLIGGLDTPTKGSIEVGRRSHRYDVRRAAGARGARGTLASSSRCTTCCRCSPRRATSNCRCC